MKSKRRFRGIFIFFFVVLGWSLSCSTAFTEPIPIIVVNQGTSRVLVMPGAQLDLSVQFDPQEYEGVAADWWLYAEVAGTYYYYDYLSASWVPGFQVTAQGALTTLPPFNVLSLRGLPAGVYNVTFGVDLNMNGQLGHDAFLDTMEFTIPDYVCPDTVNTLDALSEDQKAFVTSRGNPEMFILGLISEQFDNENRATYLENNNIRRIEYWLYNRDQLTMVLFDNGHFVEETIVGDSIDELQATHISPSQLSPCMDQTDIVALLGEPSCTQTEILAGRTYSYLRYNPSGDHPASTVVLENGVLTTVLAGYSFDMDSSPTDGNLCTD